MLVQSRGLAHVEADLAGDVLGAARAVRDGESHVNDLTLQMDASAEVNAFASFHLVGKIAGGRVSFPIGQMDVGNARAAGFEVVEEMHAQRAVDVFRETDAEVAVEPTGLRFERQVLVLIRRVVRVRLDGDVRRRLSRCPATNAGSDHSDHEDRQSEYVLHGNSKLSIEKAGCGGSRAHPNTVLILGPESVPV